MAWSGGNYTRIGGSSAWVDDRDAANPIVSGPNGTSDSHDEHDEDLAEGLENCITLDGQNSPSGDIDMGGFTFNDVGTNIGTAFERDQYASVPMIQLNTAITGGSGGSGSAYTLTISKLTAYVDGMMVIMRSPTAANTSTTPTLNINAIGAVTIVKNAAEALSTSPADINQNTAAIFVYKTTGGNRFQLLNPVA